MSKKHIIFIIPLIVAAVIMCVSGAEVYSQSSVGLNGHYPEKGGPGATVNDCNACHEFDVGYYDNPAPNFNLRWVKRSITDQFGIPHAVVFTRFSPAPGTLADGSPPYDGACEVCHTGLAHHNQDGSGSPHYNGTNCSSCHPHFTNNIVNYFEPRFAGNQSHYTHWNDPKGPMLGTNNCTYCHNPNDFHLFADGKPLVPEPGYPTGTAVCDPCHSKGGPYDGVGSIGTCSVTTTQRCWQDSDCPSGQTCNENPNWVAYGAKYNWENGAYKPAVAPAPWPSELRGGKGNWCAGCHDDGTSVIYSVSAPNVMGDNVAYGYNVTGHGIKSVACTDCHDATAIHTDGNARTYSASLNNYQIGYRLNTDMTIPRYGQYGPGAFNLCFLRCHDYNKVFGTDSSFRDDNLDLYLHETHLGQTFRFMWAWDSDWSGGACDELHYGAGCDSAMSCTACHNVHGSPCVIGSSIVPCANPDKFPMIRHGELISTPGTQDKVPALQFHWYDNNNVPTTDFDASRWGGMLCSNSSVQYNHVCWGCHRYEGEITYYRGPCGPKKVKVNNVWTTDTDPGNTPKTIFHPGDPIRYHVSFNLGGTASSYFVQDHGVAQKSDGTGPKHDWYTSQTIAPCNTYEWTMDKVIPTTISPPPTGIPATVTITVNMYDRPGGLLLSTDVNSSPFTVMPR